MKKGDTLVEVTIAIGIFSLFAIGVASVTSSGTAGSQSALETTLTREEIDSQTEALRFIHSAYISSRENADSPYLKLWQKITENANEPNESIVRFTPNSCAELYQDDNLISQNAFILNTRNLNDGEKAYISAVTDRDKSDAAKVFQQTITYPRVIFGSATNNSSSGSLIDASNIDASNNNDIYRAEGIYIIAVQDDNTTSLVGEDGQSANSQPAFYDFYVRACWYGLDSEIPSTISTVIRLYDPPVLST